MSTSFFVYCIELSVICVSVVDVAEFILDEELVGWSEGNRGANWLRIVGVTFTRRAILWQIAIIAVALNMTIQKVL